MLSKGRNCCLPEGKRAACSREWRSHSSGQGLGPQWYWTCRTSGLQEMEPVSQGAPGAQEWEQRQNAAGEVAGFQKGPSKCRLVSGGGLGLCSTHFS